MKIRPVGVVSCGRTEGQTDRYDETNNHFRSFSIEPKNDKLSNRWAPVIFFVAVRTQTDILYSFP